MSLGACRGGGRFQARGYWQDSSVTVTAHRRHVRCRVIRSLLLLIEWPEAEPRTSTDRKHFADIVQYPVLDRLPEWDYLPYI